jgi:hypothetical protein
VSDETRSFDRKNKIVGGLGGPAFETWRALQGVKGAVDFDGVESFGGVFEFEFLF